MKFFSSAKDKIEWSFGKVGLELVEDWHKLWKKYSFLVFVVMGAIPDLYNLAISTGFLTSASAPPLLDQFVKGVAFFGGATTMIKLKAKARLEGKDSDSESDGKP
jgi:hypothetical protein